MARRNRNGVRKERMIMLASSVLVLTALTVTGVFVQRSNRAEKEDYVVDFETIEQGSNTTADNMMTGEELIPRLRKSEQTIWIMIPVFRKQIPRK